MKRQIAGLGMILLFIMLPAWLIIRPFGPAEVVVTQAEYRAASVLIRVYAGEEGTDSRWVLMGTRADDNRLTLLDGENRAVLSTTGYADSRHAGPVKVRFERLRFGLGWVPELLVSFAPAGELPVLTSENAAAIAAEFRTALGR